jgi:hypothetical protein
MATGCGSTHPTTQPGMAALWQRMAHRWRGFDHIEPQFRRTAARTTATAPALGPYPIESCGYSLTSLSAPFVGMWSTCPSARET